MKIRLRLLLICFLILLVPIISVSAATTDSDNVPYDTYTYWTDISENGRKAVELKQIFRVQDVIYPSEIGDIEYSKFADICCGSDGKVYLLDGEGSFIFVLNPDFSLNTVIKNIKTSDDASISFKGAKGIYVDKNNYIYIAATVSKCVWKIDIYGNVINEYLLPDSNIVPEGFQFSPTKVTVDSEGYVYVLCEGSFYGAILYSPTNEFLGFYGANSVTATVTDALKQVIDRLFTNDVKKSQSVKALPFNMTDIVVDSDDFVYTATGTTIEEDKGQIKRFNPGGKNVISGDEQNFADDNATIDYYGTYIGNNLSEIAVSDNYIYGLSKSYGKVFVYNRANELICVFGGGISEGNQKGTFVSSCAIDVYGDKVLVLDGTKNTITVFSPTEYGSLVMEASNKVMESDYIGAAPIWNEILKRDGNNQLAYKYLAKAAYTEKNYESAMEYAKAGYERTIYEQAFEAHRDTLIRKNFGLIVLFLAILIIVIIVCIIFLKKKNILKIKNQKIKLMFSTLFHPFDAHTTIKTKNQGSVLICFVLLILYFVTEIVKTTRGGFIFTYYDASSFNALFILAKTAGIIILWVIVNWAISTLFGGIGKMKEIFVVTCYSLLPMIIGNVISVIATNTLLTSEAGFLNVILVVLTAYTFVLIAIGTIIVHDFSFTNFLWTTLLTIIGMMIVAFVGFLLWMVVQQTFSFIATIINEIIYR